MPNHAFHEPCRVANAPGDHAGAPESTPSSVGSRSWIAPGVWLTTIPRAGRLQVDGFQPLVAAMVFAVSRVDDFRGQFVVR
jgi:hypothetical protein